MSFQKPSSLPAISISMGHVHCAVMCSDALSDNVTVQTKKEI